MVGGLQNPIGRGGKGNVMLRTQKGKGREKGGWGKKAIRDDAYLVFFALTLTFSFSFFSCIWIFRPDDEEHQTSYGCWSDPR
ncbi:hypothetical protein BDV28DRAFT_138474 [Aspergillus coremiiformis]|uniref:Transmembrane protein n=1 Tax=Aspergillus coremiiformis TaxID=138285 RepID=A0A5N6Z252_9EURO|nr:hypothetical protein BDV28DRAFT_138474 [Aspergillus coremiiformis]